MSDLSDFKRIVYEPEVAKLKTRIAELQEQLKIMQLVAETNGDDYRRLYDVLWKLNDWLAETGYGESLPVELRQQAGQALAADRYPATEPEANVIYDNEIVPDRQSVVCAKCGHDSFVTANCYPASSPKGVGGAPWHPKGANQVPALPCRPESQSTHCRYCGAAPEYQSDECPARSPASRQDA